MALRSHDQFPGERGFLDSRRKSLKTGRCSGLDAWIVPAFCSGSSPHRALKRGRCSQWDPNFVFSFLTQCYYPHTSRESEFPVCRIIFFIIQKYINISQKNTLKVLLLCIFQNFYPKGLEKCDKQFNLQHNNVCLVKKLTQSLKMLHNRCLRCL